MVSIAICDDDKLFVDRLSTLVEEYVSRNSIEISLNKFYDADSFLQSNVSEYQVMLLDIDLGNKNGIEVARELRNKEISAIIVYISAYIEMAPRGYEVNAFRYILKNDLDQILNYTLDDVIKELESRNKVYEITTKGKSESIYLSDIRYFESFKRYVNIHVGENEYKQYRKISELETELSERGFLRIHKSFLVNMEYIECFQNKEAILKDGKVLPCSKMEYKNIVSRYMIWKGRR